MGDPMGFALLPCSRNTKLKLKISSASLTLLGEENSASLDRSHAQNDHDGILWIQCHNFGAGKSNILTYLLQYQSQPRSPGLFTSMKSCVHLVSVVFALT